ncbi:hypothetical protein D9619_009167 [Psilocybe cf. subviscida]|uniref:Uncharacterized protein n=1 Tax=Psilocybe cf. subviscida TaxID=2480587 RepID=A0A8H5BTU0_9AGAR|nr:hypothetical protein D9619_009167 [Psilocybe cf. subviscida]
MNPTQVHPRPSQHQSDQFSTDQDPRNAHHASVKQQQHREALRLALGSILTPLKKRPPLSASSRSSSGSASPAYFGMHSASGTHTPSGTPPVTSSGTYSQAYGPNSSEYLHPHGHHPHPPSRLRPSSHSPASSGNLSPTSSLPSTGAPSSISTPHLGGAPDVIIALPDPSDIELLPPAGPTQHTAAAGKPTRPPIRPLQATKEGVAQTQLAASGPINERTLNTTAAAGTASAPVSGYVTPKSKFLQTLQILVSSVMEIGETHKENSIYLLEEEILLAIGTITKQIDFYAKITRLQCTWQPFAASVRRKVRKSSLSRPDGDFRRHITVAVDTTSLSQATSKGLNFT